MNICYEWKNRIVYFCSVSLRGWNILESMLFLNEYTRSMREDIVNILKEILQMLVAIEKLSQNTWNSKRTDCGPGKNWIETSVSYLEWLECF